MSTFALLLSFLYHCWKVDMSAITEWRVLGVLAATQCVEFLRFVRNLPFVGPEGARLVAPYKYIQTREVLVRK